MRRLQLYIYGRRIRRATNEIHARRDAALAPFQPSGGLVTRAKSARSRIGLDAARRPSGILIAGRIQRRRAPRKKRLRHCRMYLNYCRPLGATIFNDRGPWKARAVSFSFSFSLSPMNNTFLLFLFFPIILPCLVLLVSPFI